MIMEETQKKHFYLLRVVWHHLLLEEAPDTLSEDVMVLIEDPASANVHQGLGCRGLWACGGCRMTELLGLTVLQSGKNYRNSINHTFPQILQILSEEAHTVSDLKLLRSIQII